MTPQYITTPKSKKTIEALWRLQKIILDSLDFNVVIQEIVDSVLLELGYLKLGYEIVVLSLIDEKRQVLQRISISHTQKAQQALLETPVPFHEITIPLNYKRNLLIKALRDKAPQSTTNWSDILMPSFTKDQSAQIQKILNIKSSLVYPVLSRNKAIGTLIFSMSKSDSKVSIDERDLIRSFSDIVGLAVQNSSLYSQVDQANLRLKKANKDLRHLDKLKDEFVFIATHELKNPVTVMRGYLYMLNQKKFGEIPEKMKSPVEEMNNSNQQLVQLVNDLLQIARAEAKTIKIKTDPVNLCQIADEVINNVKPLADQKQLALQHKCEVKGEQILADSNRLKEILNNLVSNAIKYSQTGIITISHSEDEKKKNRVITSISDQGVGMSDEDQKKIFTRFFRSEEEANRGIPGTGLGLFIVKQLVERMGGKIWFTSEIGKGSTFSFSLPKA